MTDLRTRIDAKTAQIVVIGLGYVGLPVAIAFALEGFPVVGLDVNESRVSAVNQGEWPFSDEPGLPGFLADVVEQGRLRATTCYDVCESADVVLIAVQTPIDAQRRPDYSALRAVLGELAPRVKAGALVIVESTLAPGTMASVVQPALPHVMLAHCPERLTPGRLLYNLRTCPRVVGGITPEAARVASHLYSHIVEAGLSLADCITAELVKCTENAYRDVQIAFANEVALICEQAGGDVWRVRELVNKCPGRSMHEPGAGVGGHCIPKDTWLLIHGHEDSPRLLLRQARQVNASMPLHVADLLVEELRAAGRPLDGARVAILGQSYRADSDDARNSPTDVLCDWLDGSGAELQVHDPHVPGYGGNWRQVVVGADAVVLMTAHSAYKAIDLLELRAMLRTPILIDGRHCFDAAQAKEPELHYRCIGVGL